MTRWILVFAVLGCAVAAASAALEDEVRSLFEAARYDDASARLDESSATDATTLWWRARLATDPDEFERLAIEAARQAAPNSELALQIGLARAREHFARGRYQTAVTILESFLVEEGPADPELLLWLGMAHQATGAVKPAETAFESIPKDAPQFPDGQVLLAELALRTGRPRRAAQLADRVLDAEPRLAAPALSVLYRVARSAGDEEAAADYARRLRERAPRSVEATGIAPQPAKDVASAQRSAARDDGLEVEAPANRSTFSLQLGAFRDRALALRLVSNVRDQVDELRIEVDRTEDPTLYRVVSGSFGTRSQAEARRDELRSIGIETFLLAPGRQVR